MKPWKWYVYILECKDGTYYTGCTWNVANRLEQHLSGFGAKYTGRHGFKRVLYVEEFTDLESARLREKQIQGWTRKKKEKLIKGEWE